MEQQISRASLLNTYSVAADVINSNGIISVSGLPNMKTVDFITVTQVVPVTEVVQVVTIGASTPVVTASTKYNFLIGNTGAQRGGYNLPLTKIGYTSPAVLAVSVFVDRYNLQSSMAKKINALPNLNATAYPVITVAYVTSVAFTVGNIAVDTLTGAKGLIIADTGVLLTLGVISGVWGGIATGTSASGTITETTPAGVVSAGASTNATHVTVAGIALRIVDTVGYFNAKGTRFGVNTVMVTGGFASTDLVITTAGVYGLGQGTRMLQDVPVKELLSDNLAAGRWDFNVDHAPSVLPTAGATYSLFILRYTIKPDGEVGAMQLANQEVHHALWLNQAGSTSTIAQMLTALQAL